MKNEYIEEIISLSNKDKFITPNLIKKIIEDRVNQEDSNVIAKFNGVTFGNTNWCGDVMCSCDITDGNIIVNYKKIIGEYKKIKKINLLEQNLRILSYLFHEVNHLKEESIIELLNFESLLISYSGLDIFYPIVEKKIKHIRYLLDDNLYKKILDRKINELYLKIYDKIPAERIANIRSYKEVLEAIYNYPNFKENYNKELKYINELYKDQYYLGYDNYKKQDKYYTGPLLDYLKFIKMPDLLDDFDFYCEDIKRFIEKSSKEFTIEERMLYGLPITLEETNELDKKLILTK